MTDKRTQLVSRPTGNIWGQAVYVYIKILLFLSRQAQQLSAFHLPLAPSLNLTSIISYCRRQEATRQRGKEAKRQEDAAAPNVRRKVPSSDDSFLYPPAVFLQLAPSPQARQLRFLINADYSHCCQRHRRQPVASTESHCAFICDSFIFTFILLLPNWNFCPRLALTVAGRKCSGTNLRPPEFPKPCWPPHCLHVIVSRSEAQPSIGLIAASDRSDCPLPSTLCYGWS